MPRGILRLIVFGFGVVFILAFETAALADKRVALVIGNDAYRHMPSLFNARNDAEDVGKTLRELGFTTIVATDLDRAAINEALDRFSRTVAGAHIALVYYSGHGMQLAGKNYLLPIDSRLEGAEDVNRFRLMPLDDVLDVLQTAAGARVIILDACRNNPVEENLKRRMASVSGANRDAFLTRGLGRISAGNGLIVAYATQANDVAADGTARNSPFTSAFLRHARDDVDLRQMLFRVQDEVDRVTQGRQRPELSISLVGEFKLKVAVLAPLTPPAAAPSVESARPVVGTFPQVPAARPLTPAEERALRPRDSFKECDACPEMVVVPAGSFTMGSPGSEKGRFGWEGPQHQVTIKSSFAVGKFEVTFAEWDVCVGEGGCDGYRPPDQGWGRGRRPVINVSWNDAKLYLAWLSRRTGKAYRLLTEAEWEYAARAGRTTPYHFGDDHSVICSFANGPDLAAKKVYPDDDALPCDDGFVNTAPVGSFQANQFGLHDVLGNVWEWTEDCWNDSYRGAPSDGTAWITANCARRMVRGGAWHHHPRDLRSARRYRDVPESRTTGIGFRVARTLAP